MKKNAQRILSGFLAVLMLSVAAVPAYALSVPGTLYQTIDFYSYVYGIYKDWRVGNPDTDYSQYPGFRGGGFGSDPDKVGGGSFSKDEAQSAYNDYVSTLPASGYNSDGSLQYSPVHDYFELYYSSGSSYGNEYRYCEHHEGEHGASDRFSFNFNCASNSISVFPVSGGLTFKSVSARFYYKGIAPIDGYYTRLSTPKTAGYFLDADEARHSLEANWDLLASSTYYAAGATFAPYCSSPSFCSFRDSSKFAFIQGIPPVYKITPAASLSGDTYNINSRPTSITGGNYGIVGDNGQITKVEDNSTIVNETNNTFYNPAIGATVPITNWSYDYSDRSYKVTLESGDTVTITYGDENIVIKEGDTVYNIYYLIDGSGSENPPCAHEWAETSTTPATCTMPGSKLSTCSKCQQTKKEALPALGHDWQVKKTVTTEYDDTGQLIQQGYTIFQCSRCKEQYKSTEGTIPPGGPSTDPGGGEDDGTIIGDLIEKLLSGLGGIVGGIIKGLLSLLTKAVEALAGLAELFTTFVGSLVELWGGFTSFLSVVFPFLPEEFVVIIEFGLILMIAAAVFKKFLS